MARGFPIAIQNRIRASHVLGELRFLYRRMPIPAKAWAPLYECATLSIASRRTICKSSSYRSYLANLAAVGRARDELNGYNGRH